LEAIVGTNQNVSKNAPRQDGDPELGVLVDAWLASRSGKNSTLARSTISNDARHAGYLPAWLRGTRASALTANDGIDLLEEVGRSPRTRAKTIAVVKRAWRRALATSMTSIPYPWHTLDIVTVPPHVPDPLSDRERDRLWAAALRWADSAPKNAQARRELALIATMLWCGLRISEARALNVGDIHVDNRNSMHIKRRVTDVDGSAVTALASGSGRRARRTVPLIGPAVDIVPAWTDIRRGRGAADEDRLFRNRNSRNNDPVPYRTLWRSTHRLAADAEVDSMHLNRLRDTAGATMERLGVAPVTIAVIMGYKNLAGSKRRGTLTDSELNDVVTRMAVHR
jgi:integrase